MPELTGSSVTVRDSHVHHDESFCIEYWLTPRPGHVINQYVGLAASSLLVVKCVIAELMVVMRDRRS